MCPLPSAWLYCSFSPSLIRWRISFPWKMKSTRRWWPVMPRANFLLICPMKSVLLLMQFSVWMPWFWGKVRKPMSGNMPWRFRRPGKICCPSSTMFWILQRLNAVKWNWLWPTMISAAWFTILWTLSASMQMQRIWILNWTSIKICRPVCMETMFAFDRF